ncbi:NYN domain-containing protein [Pedococcus bigeumensis]|uniref:NYN domain-containing protein n=1 Tax=Pedococcus bigeumensis TaxID=433644 RepID=UPI0031E085E5
MYVDVGYLLAAAATRVTGTSLRSGVVISYPDLIAAVIQQAERQSGLPVLRVHWYDSGAKSGGAPDSSQEAIGELPRVKLRLGRLSPRGEQKGVDLRIGLDLASHGRNRVSDLVYLMSGDDDLTEAVEEAQSHGVQVVILAVPDALGRSHAVSRHLLRECDDIMILDPATIDSTVHVRTQASESASCDNSQTGERPVSPVGPAPRSPEASEPSRVAAAPSPSVLAGTRPVARTSLAQTRNSIVYSSSSDGSGRRPAPPADQMTIIDQVCRGVVAAWLGQAGDTDRDGVMREEPFIPNDLDRTLLTDLSARLGVYDIDESTRYALRAHFWEVMHAAS